MTEPFKDSQSRLIFPECNSTAKTFTPFQLANLGQEIIHSKIGIKRSVMALQGDNNYITASIILSAWLNRDIVFMLPKECNPADLLGLAQRGLISHLIKVESVRRYEIKEIELFNADEDPSISSEDCEEMKNLRVDGGIIMCTSGSTGKPKAIGHSWERLKKGARNVIESYQLNQTDTAHCLLPLTHINGLVTTLIAPCLSNSAVVFQQQPFVLADYFKNLAVFYPSWLSASPYYLNLIANSIETKINHSYRFIRTASAPLSESLLEEITEIFECPIVNSMGMTEAAGQIFTNLIDKPQSTAVGYPINTEVSVLQGNQIANEGTGELLIKGSTVISSYLFTKGKNKESHHEEWLRTGDLVSIEPNKLTRISGRIKNILNFCGLKFQIEEMEQSIELHTGQRVVGIPVVSKSYGEQLRLAVEANGSENLHLEKLFTDATGLLHSAAIIESIVIVDKYPLLPSRKIDRASLKQAKYREVFKPNSIDLISKSGIPDIQAIKKLITSLLSIDADMIDENSTQDDFPEWDSLVSMQIANAIEDNLGRELALEEIILCESISGIISLIEDDKITKQDASKKQRNGKNRLEGNNLSELLKQHGREETNLLYIIPGWEFVKALGFESPVTFIEVAKDIASNDCNIIMNSFTWKFISGVPFISKKTRCEVGIVPEALRLFPGSYRSQSAIYSYSLLYPDSELSHDAQECWGYESTAYKLFNHPKARVIHLGIGKKGSSLIKGNACCHVAEKVIGTPARVEKCFTGFSDINQSRLNVQTESIYVRSEDYRYKPYEWGFCEQILLDHKRTKTDHTHILSYQMQDLKTILLNELENNPLAPFQNNPI